MCMQLLCPQPAAYVYADMRSITTALLRGGSGLHTCVCRYFMHKGQCLKAFPTENLLENTGGWRCLPSHYL